MVRRYSFDLILDTQRVNGLPIRGAVCVEYEYTPPDVATGFRGRIAVVGVSKLGRPMRRLEKYLLSHHADYLDEQACYDWIERDG